MVTVVGHKKKMFNPSTGLYQYVYVGKYRRHRPRRRRMKIYRSR